MTVVGNVSNPIGNVTGKFDTLILDGTSTGNAINGAISDTAGVTVGNGDTRITKDNTSTWTLNGANTYTGATVINGGTLRVGNAQGAGFRRVEFGGHDRRRRRHARPQRHDRGQ